MAEASGTVSVDRAAPVALTPEDWDAFHQRAGSRGEDFFDVSMVPPPERKGAAAAATGDGNQRRKPGEGDGAPGGQPAEASGEADGQPKSEGPEGEGDPDNKPPKKGKQLPPWMARRLRRASDKHAKALAAVRAENEELAAKVAELEARAGGDTSGAAGDGGKKPKGDGDGGKAAATHAGKTPADLEWEDQYKALGILDLGPEPGDYSDTRQWLEDFDLWGENKPLQHHPKLTEKISDAAGDGGKQPPKEKPSSAANAGNGEGEPEAPTDAAKFKAWADRQWSTLEAAFDENEDADPNTEFGTKLYDAFTEAIDDKQFGLWPEALEHLADSDDGPEIVKILVDSPRTAMRLFNKPRNQQGRELDKILARARKRAEAGNAGGGDDGGGGANDRGGKVMPRVDGAGAGGGAVDPSQMSFADYRQYRESQQTSRGDFYFNR